MEKQQHSEANTTGERESAFAMHVDYNQLLTGPHRRKVEPLNTPALTRNLGFWRPPSPEINRVAREEAQLRRNNVDNYVVDLYQSLQRIAGSKSHISGVSNSYITEIDGFRIESLLGRVKNLDDDNVLPINSPRPDPYRVLRIYFFWYDYRVTLAFQLHTESVEISVSIELGSDLEKGSDASGRLPMLIAEAIAVATASTVAPDPIYRFAHNTLFQLAWEEFDTIVFAPLSAVKRRLGEKALDFRGFVTSARDVDRRGFKSSIVKLTKLDIFIGESKAKEITQEKSFCRIDEFRRFLPLITSPLIGPSDITVSWFMDGRSIYATALGDSSIITADSKHHALCYLLYEDVATRSELGRLIDHIHHAGATRIAACMQFAQLRQAGDGLRRAEKSLEDAFSALSEAERNKQGSEEAPDIKEIRDSAREHYNTVETELAHATQSVVGEALEYRVQRSRYYVAQFNNAVKALAIGKVEGFQRYDDFVYQRLGTMFEYIDRLGDRLARVQRDRGVLLDRLEGLESLIEETAISEVQKVGDIALFGALLPYYASHVISTIAEGKISEKIIYLFFFVIGASVATYKGISPRYKWLQTPFHERARATVIITGLILVWAAILWISGDRMIGASVGHASGGKHAEAPHSEPTQHPPVRPPITPTQKVPKFVPIQKTPS